MLYGDFFFSFRRTRSCTYFAMLHFFCVFERKKRVRARAWFVAFKGSIHESIQETLSQCRRLFVLEIALLKLILRFGENNKKKKKRKAQNCLFVCVGICT